MYTSSWVVLEVVYNYKVSRYFSFALACDVFVVRLRYHYKMYLPWEIVIILRRYFYFYQLQSPNVRWK
jgi:hypothetical protein